MAEPKPFSPYEEQLSILRGRGLAIPDEELALQWLREKNYYRLSAYSLTLRQRDTATGNDKFFDALYQLLPQNERFTFASCIQVCFAEHPSAKPSELGFPSNWHELIK